MIQLDKARSDDSASQSEDRRSNLALREVLDELIEHVRGIARSGSNLSSEEAEYRQQRLEWLADEAWRLSSEGGQSESPE
ncbi:MAG: hypothetical protein ACE5HT_02440 [Gemmatimonadales bacterium]